MRPALAHRPAARSLGPTAPPPPQARVNVPDDRFKWLCEEYKPKSEVPAFLEIVDIAGLVKGARLDAWNS